MKKNQRFFVGRIICCKKSKKYMIAKFEKVGTVIK